MTNAFRVLHLATDDKFVDQALRLFERFLPAANDLYVYSVGDLRYVKSLPVKIVGRVAAISGRVAKDFPEYDLVVVHSLDPVWWRTLVQAPLDVPVLWLGWGFDYYDFIVNGGGQLLLPLTQQQAGPAVASKSLNVRLKQFLWNLLFGVEKAKVVEKIAFFAPVLPSEYDLLRKCREWRKFPRQVVWNYGSLEEDFVKGFSDAEVSGLNILVGNSATPTNNHIDAFVSLAAQDRSGRKIIVPLSYGNRAYRDVVMGAGEEYFGDRFTPLLDFMPIDAYVRILQSCGFAVMNHVRQQAVGNIVIMLYLGATVFLRTESPAYVFFREQGLILHTIEELEQQPGLLVEGLDPEARRCNRERIIEYWSEAAAERKTAVMIEQILGLGSPLGGAGT